MIFTDEHIKEYVALAGNKFSIRGELGINDQMHLSNSMITLTDNGLPSLEDSLRIFFYHEGEELKYDINLRFVPDNEGGLRGLRAGVDRMIARERILASEGYDAKGRVNVENALAITYSGEVKKYPDLKELIAFMSSGKLWNISGGQE